MPWHCTEEIQGVCCIVENNITISAPGSGRALGPWPRPPAPGPGRAADQEEACLSWISRTPKPSLGCGMELGFGYHVAYRADQGEEGRVSGHQLSRPWNKLSQRVVLLALLIS